MEQVIEEFGCNPDDGLHRVIRSFFLTTRNGPLEAIAPGSIVRLTPATAQETFYAGKTEPLEIGEVFEVLQAIQVVGSDGLWIKAAQGDQVKLDRSEAVELLRQNKIRERKGE
jgi:hypothetical protein